uniref:Neuron navigator 1 n=1 Tax=Periophthalmus magnuspinnatus TaxID=409849 RepID=A0A3B3ZFE9_9GOBI
MLEANVANISMTAKPRDLDLRSPAVPSTDYSSQAMASRKTMAKPSALPQGQSRTSGSELKVYRPTSGSIPIPVPNSSGLRKQRSLNNLCVLTDAEKKLHLYQSPRWNDDSTRAGPGAKGAESKAGQSAGRPPLSRTLSKSEQSLFQGKPKPFVSPAVTSNIGKPSRIPGPGKPRGPYAEVKPISKSSDHNKTRSASLSVEDKKDKKGVEGEGDKGFLKVDPELVVTVLGDLEQLLFSQMLDPESQRKRTVQNVLDLRQNLEETMTSLRGVQLSHSYDKGPTCYDSDEAAAFSVASLSNRSSPLSWRQGQASPRLQAGDAPSTGNTQSDVPLRISHTARIQLIEALDDQDPALLKGEYLSDSDVGGKSTNEEEDDDDIDLGNGWDESSSISSGLSDGSDNLSSEEFNTSPTLNSLPTTPISSRRNSAIVMRTDAEKRSLVESGLSWDADDSKPSRKSLGSSIYETGSLKSESAQKWRKSKAPGEGLEGGRGELKKPQALGQGNMLKKARNPPVGVTSPITHTAPSGLKVPGVVKPDGKPMEKSRLAVKSSGLQRSSSDAGKEKNGSVASEPRKPPSGLVRPSTGGNFGFKKPIPTGMSTASTIPSGSATVGKSAKTTGIPVKPAGSGGGGRKTSLDVSNSDQSGFLSPNARTSLQYRSLPRPAKTSTLTLTRPSSARPLSTTVDTSSGLVKPSTPQTSRLKEPGTGLCKPGNRGIPSPVNQTDREKEKEKERAKAKAVVSDSECGSLKSSPALTSCETGSKLQGLRPPNKSTDILTKPSMVHHDKENISLDIGVQDSLPPKIPPYSKIQDLASSSSSCLSPSPAPLLNVNSSSCFSSSGTGLGPRQVSSLGVGESEGSTSPLLYPRLTGLHRSLESLPLQMSLAPEPQREREREALVRGYTTLESRDRDRKDDRAPPAGWSSAKVPRMVLIHVNQFPKQWLIYNYYFFQQIRMLRRELESSQEKVSNLTTQLTANVRILCPLRKNRLHLSGIFCCFHFEQDTELMELRETIESLKAKNDEAQAVIQGALNNPDNMKDLRIRRQNSCESISSLNSLTSMSSLGSLKDQDAKKKKKKSWLRSSFNKAFSIKKGTKTYSDIEEIVTPDSSAPNSPKMLHESMEGGETAPLSLTTSVSTTSCAAEEGEEEEEEERMVSDLRSELWDKERELTDIRLEALNSAHQLEQLREAMNNMQVLENLKAENDHLKTGSMLSLAGPTSSTSQPSGLASLLGTSGKQPTSLTKSFSLSLNDCKDAGKYLTLSVIHHIFLVNGRTDWACLDSMITKTFKDYLAQVDPTSSLGLSSDSLLIYQLTQGVQRVMGGDRPQTLPYRCLGSGQAQILVTLKGLREKCVDALVFETLVPKPMMLHYISLLLKHRRLVLSGPSGTGKTYLAQRLCHYLQQRSLCGRTSAVTFNMHQQSPKDLQLYLSNLANQIDRESGELPLVIIIDDISDASAITELVNGALTCKYHKCPYIIGTTNQPVKMNSNHGLHLSFRMITFSNNVEPANGFLVRYLHRKAVETYQQRELDATQHQALMHVLDWVSQLWYHLHTFLEKHSTSDFLIGPCFFLSCPVSVSEFRQWFIDLWNHSIIPYLQEGAKDGIKVHGQKAVWEDPVDWVRGTLPWPNAQQDQSKLFHLPPPSVSLSSEDKKPLKDTPPPSSLEADPLMAMLLKLQESANYIESPEREGSLDPTLQATL